MKKIPLLLTAILISFVSFAQFYAWEKLNSGITAGTLYDVKFVSDSVGFAVGNDGTTNFILKTTDAGENWQNMTTATIAQLVRGFDFIDANTLYVIGKKGSLYESLDGGTTWKAVNLATNVDLADISFPDKKAGYICTSAGRYIHFNGVGWATKTIFAADNFIAVGFPTKDEGFLSASSGRVWRTLDGGTTWDTIKSKTAAIVGSHFITANVGYIVGAKGFVQRTITGGLSWSDTLIYPDSFMDIDFRSVFFPFQNFGFIGGNEGTILRTSDGGSNWIKEKTNVTDKIYKIYAPSLKVAFAVGENGTILRRYETVGINEVKEAHFKLYPNPANDFVQIEFDQQFNPFELQVYNLDGQLVLKKSINDQKEFVLSVEAWTKGIYLINLISEQGSEWGKVMVN